MQHVKYANSATVLSGSKTEKQILNTILNLCIRVSLVFCCYSLYIYFHVLWMNETDNIDGMKIIICHISNNNPSDYIIIISVYREHQ